MNAFALNGQHHETRQWQQEQFAPGAPNEISLTERQLWHLNKADHDWRAEYLGEMPDFLARYFGDRYSKLLEGGHNGRRRANTFLRTTVGKSILPRLRNVCEQYATKHQAAGVIPFPFLADLEKLPTFGRDELRSLAHRVADFMSESFTDFIDLAFDGAAADQKEMTRRTYATFEHMGKLAKMAGISRSGVALVYRFC